MDKNKLEFVVAMAAKTTRDQLQAVTSELETRIMGFELTYGEEFDAPGYKIMTEFDDQLQSMLSEMEDYARTLGLDLAAPMIA